MKREEIFKNHRLKSLFNELNEVHQLLNNEFQNQFNRSLPFSEELLDRWERAKKLNFGENSSIYDSSFVFGNPKIGKDVWIGPFTIMDGSGDLVVGNNVTISAGVQIYTHDNIKQTLLGKDISLEHEKVAIGNNSYIGPNAVISKGVNIGAHCIIATNSFVKNSFPNNSIIAGNPAKQIGEVIIKNNNIEFNYFNNK